jgi:hypothetical protein
MNCTNCKNPIQENATECEWCGANILISNQDYSTSSNTILRFVFDGYNTLGNPNLSVFINGVLLEKGTLRGGIIFEIAHTKVLPIVQIKMDGMQKIRLEIPSLDIYKNYLVIIDYGTWVGFKSKPKSIVEF